MINFQKTFTASTLSLALASPLILLGEDAPTALEANEELGKIYTPARAALRVRQNLITPFYAYYGQLLPASISTGGKIASSTYGTGFSWLYIHPEKTHISLSNIDYRRTDFRFSSGATAPFDHTDSIRASTYQEFVNLKKGLAFVTILSATASAEDRTDLADGISGFIGLGGKQYFSEELSLTFGAATQYRPERERWTFYPLLSLDWRISPTLNFRTFDGFSLTWDVNADNSFLLDFSISYKTSAFVVESERDESSPNYGRKGAYLERNVPISIAGTWNATENIFLSGGVTLNVWSEYRLYRSGHETDDRFSTDPTFGFFFQAGVRF